MNIWNSFIAAALLSSAIAQTLTLTGCHVHGVDEFCYLPNGSEVPFTRTGSTTAAATATQATVTTTQASASSTAVVPASVTGCYSHEDTQLCLASGTAYEVVQTPSITPLPTEYSGCHSHGADIYCMASDGSEVQIALEGAEAVSEDASSSGTNCHFHGSVEHCTGGTSTTTSCVLVDRDYNMGLRIGLIFVILASSGIAVFAPILLERFTKITLNGIIFTMLKQFGTGIIISTAFVHLLTHAEIMFANDCLGGVEYESTTTAIAMAGVFLSFLIEYIGYRFILRRQLVPRPIVDGEQKHSNSSKAVGTSTPENEEEAPSNTTLAALGHHHGGHTGPDNHFNVAVMESGIIFHSILIGITLNVTPDSYYITFFVVILFHQMFEGIALGTRIAALQNRTAKLTKFLMASLFALITPIGMSIGAAVLKNFNGNDPSTIIALGTLDALSAGILLWVGLVEMLAHDWFHGDMARAGWVKITVGIGSLVLGMALMSFLGKWA